MRKGTRARAGDAPPIVVVFTTVPDAEVGARIARALVEERRAACVSLVPGLRSIYRWQGQVEDAAEVLLVAKLRADGFPAYERRMRELHPYEVAEIVALPVEGVSRAYQQWVAQECEGT